MTASHIYSTISSLPMIGDAKPAPEALATMRARTHLGSRTKWAAFQNHDLGSLQIGHMTFMAVGPGCTYSSLSPVVKNYPDWRYQFVGFVNLEDGSVDPVVTE